MTHNRAGDKGEKKSWEKMGLKEYAMTTKKEPELIAWPDENVLVHVGIVPR